MGASDLGLQTTDWPHDRWRLLGSPSKIEKVIVSYPLQTRPIDIQLADIMPEAAYFCNPPTSW